MFSDMSNLRPPPMKNAFVLVPSVPPAIGPTIVDRYMHHIMSRFDSRGYYPAALPVPAEDLESIIIELRSLPQYPRNIDDFSCATICGVPLIPIPFVDDPLYKQLQSYAALANLEITYPGVYSCAETRSFHVPFATCFANGYGWTFTHSHFAPDGRSHLDEIHVPLPDLAYPAPPPPTRHPPCSPLQSVTVRIR